MKPKSIFPISAIGLLTFTVLISLSSPAAAQMTPGDIIATAEKENAVHQKDPDYWFDKGALCATYGNDIAAIKYFQQAIFLDPQRSGAYFEQGISYGQLENYSKAVALINKALELDPQNGMYYYGRGRVYLLAGEKEKAMEDFKKAAVLDDEDAQSYMGMISEAQ